MSVKRCEVELPSSSARIQEARRKLKKMSPQKKIDLMVKAGVMTERQAAKAKKKLAEMEPS